MAAALPPPPYRSHWRRRPTGHEPPSRPLPLDPRPAGVLEASPPRPAGPPYRPRHHTPRRHRRTTHPCHTLLPRQPRTRPARTYATRHGHLTPDKDTQQNGFPLGIWLCQQRRKRRTGTLSTATALTSLDPWWNPPWPYAWHRTWQQYRAVLSTGRPIPPALQRWARSQTSLWHQLHPSQQRLMNTIGIRPEALC
ncbi:helicase associated domain-containing protein [Streptomyces massasporeus]|uniref:helicase associated domain-containing protein n=1 Tax=Streptomyces massasporeus TaxID=67324 RepID=UPI0033CB67CE